MHIEETPLIHHSRFTEQFSVESLFQRNEEALSKSGYECTWQVFEKQFNAMGVPAKPEHARAIFAKWDRDNTGRLGLMEYLALAQDHYKLALADYEDWFNNEYSSSGPETEALLFSPLAHALNIISF